MTKSELMKIGARELDQGTASVPCADLLCLSVRQPWAWLIVHGWKNVENRDWSTRVRGPILIHAGKTMTRDDYESCLLFVRGIHPDLSDRIPGAGNMARGGIVGMATILDCVTYHPSNWFCGEWGFVLADQTPLAFTPCKGALGFFRIGHNDEAHLRVGERKA